MIEVRSPLQGTVVRVAGTGDPVAAGGDVVVVESMKMEHAVAAPAAGVVTDVLVAHGDLVAVGDLLARLAPLAFSDVKVTVSKIVD